MGNNIGMQVLQLSCYNREIHSKTKESISFNLNSFSARSPGYLYNIIFC